MDPDVAAMLRGRPAPVDYRISPIARARAVVENRVHQAGPSMHEVADHHIAGAHGDFLVRVYKPDAAPHRPGILYFHGGGMVVGSVDSFDGFARTLARATDAVVVSVDYHLAPEHPYPVATDEAFEALTWLMANARRLGVDPTRIAVVGDSAGGTITAGLTLRWRDSNGTPPVRAQALLYPGVDEGFDYPSAIEFEHGPVLTLNNARWMREQYLGEDTSMVSVYAIPSRAADLGGLPPTIVFTAELDLIRDSGEAFAARLREAVGASGAVVDVSDARVGYAVAGPDAVRLLSKGCGLDLHPRVFPAGRSALTAFAQLHTLIVKRDEAPTFHLYVARSVQRHLEAWFQAAGA